MSDSLSWGSEDVVLNANGLVALFSEYADSGHVPSSCSSVESEHSSDSGNSRLAVYLEPKSPSSVDSESSRNEPLSPKQQK